MDPFLGLLLSGAVMFTLVADTIMLRRRKQEIKRLKKSCLDWHNLYYALKDRHDKSRARIEEIEVLSADDATTIRTLKEENARLREWYDGEIASLTRDRDEAKEVAIHFQKKFEEEIKEKLNWCEQSRKNHARNETLERECTRINNEHAAIVQTLAAERMKWDLEWKRLVQLCEEGKQQLANKESECKQYVHERDEALAWIDEANSTANKARAELKQKKEDHDLTKVILEGSQAELACVRKHSIGYANALTKIYNDVSESYWPAFGIPVKEPNDDVDTILSQNQQPACVLPTAKTPSVQINDIDPAITFAPIPEVLPSTDSVTVIHNGQVICHTEGDYKVKVELAPPEPKSADDLTLEFEEMQR